MIPRTPFIVAVAFLGSSYGFLLPSRSSELWTLKGGGDPSEDVFTPLPLVDEEEEQEAEEPETKTTGKMIAIPPEVPVRLSRDEEYMLMAIAEAESE